MALTADQKQRLLKKAFLAPRIICFCLAVFLNMAAMPTARAQQTAPPDLIWPIDCELDKTCWIARYMDRKSGTGQGDYRCGMRTQDNHKGTDIALSDFGAMKTGVAVHAAANGRVLALRNGMPDIVVTKERRAKILKQGCGNVIIVGHGGGWRTRYCHLKKDSLLVKEGDIVVAGQPIAQVGLSGITEFPHLHFMLHRNVGGKPIDHIDPFDSGLFEDDSCAATRDGSPDTFWAEVPDYQPSALLPPVIDTARRTRETMWNPQAEAMASDSPQMIVQTRGFHALEGDEWRIQLVSPDGGMALNHTITQKNNRQRILAFAGLRKPEAGFTKGRWSARVKLIRGGATIGDQSITVLVE